MISSKALILFSGKGRSLLIQVNQNPSIFLWPLLAHRVISLLRNNQVAFKVKRTSMGTQNRPVRSRMTLRRYIAT
jgi:hypothetical protein